MINNSTKVSTINYIILVDFNWVLYLSYCRVVNREATIHNPHVTWRRSRFILGLASVLPSKGGGGWQPNLERQGFG